MPNMKVLGNSPTLFLSLKAVFLFSTAIYLLGIPAYAAYVAFPAGTADALLPVEVLFCIFLSQVCFVWFAKTCWSITKCKRN